MLTHEELESYHSKGYLVIDGVFTPAEVEQLRGAVADPALGNALEDKGYSEKGVHLLELTTRSPAFRKLSCDERLTERVAKLLGPDLQLQHSKLATKPPKTGAGEFSWHQDFPYFPHTNFGLVAVMVMLDDATPDNGCMYVIPGSHRLGPLNHLVDGVFNPGCQEPNHWQDRATWEALTPRAGGISIHHCLTLHASPHNLSGKPRRGVVYQYRADDAAQLYSHVFADTGFRVRGETRGVIRFEAQTLRLPQPQAVDPAPANLYFQVGAQAAIWNRNSHLANVPGSNLRTTSQQAASPPTAS